MKTAAWWLPLLLVTLITPFTPYLDLATSQYFFDLGGGQFISNRFTEFWFHYGVMPADITVAIALLVLIGSFFYKGWKKWQKAALLCIFTLGVGGGVIVHLMLKDHWGRPRPKQVIEFGGTQPFRPYYKPNFFNQPEPSKSFACGHCTTGFFFFALALIGKRIKSEPVFYFGLFLALFMGITLSVVRIAQGGHFFSDTLITALIMWEVALFFDFIIFKGCRKQKI